MAELIITKNDEIVMKLLHYFITNQGYNPIILHGAENEIWLENLNHDYKIVRIVSNYIHNDEQLGYDTYRTRKIMKTIQKKTLSFNMNILSIFVNLGENVHLDSINYNDICFASVTNSQDLNNYHAIMEVFPDITKKIHFKEKGKVLFDRIIKEINQVTDLEIRKNEDVFKIKKPIVTYSIILIHLILFLAMYIFGNGSRDSHTLVQFGASFVPFIKLGEYYRLITSAFLHIGVLHFLFNNYALYVIGPQLESFFGRGKFLCIYLFSAVAGNLFSMLFIDSISAGASGAIFGLLGALLYFGYHYRIYLGNVIKSQIIPLILINLFIGFTMSGINNAAHIGGLLGGVLISIALGVKYKSTTFEKINGWIMVAIYSAFLIYLGFIH